LQAARKRLLLRAISENSVIMVPRLVTFNDTHEFIFNYFI
jgi:hypothetical protein